MAQKNTKLNKAKLIKNDEFYTKIQDIGHEINNYKDFLKDKRIICPCDWDGNFCDGNGSKCQFIHFLEQNKTSWKIKSIDWSGWNPNDPNNNQELKNISRFQDVDYSNYDVVITNPPFSQFREFIDKMMKYPHLKFIIIGSQGAMSFKEIAKLIFENKIWTGWTFPKEFLTQNNEIKKFGNICWYTNIDIKKRNEKLYLQESYYKKTIIYEKAINMDVLYINKVKEIPFDYEKPMSVPISFMFSYNPNQFKILGTNTYYKYGFDKACDLLLNNKRPYQGRFIIKNLKPVKNQEEQYE